MDQPTYEKTGEWRRFAAFVEDSTGRRHGLVISARGQVRRISWTPGSADAEGLFVEGGWSSAQRRLALAAMREV